MTKKDEYSNKCPSCGSDRIAVTEYDACSTIGIGKEGLIEWENETNCDTDNEWITCDECGLKYPLWLAHSNWNNAAKIIGAAARAYKASSGIALRMKGVIETKDDITILGMIEELIVREIMLYANKTPDGQKEAEAIASSIKEGAKWLTSVANAIDNISDFS